MLAESSRVPDSILELFNRGRKLDWSAVFISSSWVELDKRVRNCVDLVLP